MSVILAITKERVCVCVIALCLVNVIMADIEAGIGFDISSKRKAI